MMCKSWGCGLAYGPKALVQRLRLANLSNMQCCKRFGVTNVLQQAALCGRQGRTLCCFSDLLCCLGL